MKFCDLCISHLFIFVHFTFNISYCVLIVGHKVDEPDQQFTAKKKKENNHSAQTFYNKRKGSMFIKISGGVKTLLKTFALGIPIGVTLIDVVGYVAKVEGHSMQPLLNPEPENRIATKKSSDYVFLHNWPIVTNSYDQIKRGEIIALVSPRDPKQRLIKRVIGLSGDQIETKGYYKEFVEVPPGHCWVEGDHRGHSLDSNIFGPVALGLIKSKAKCIVWPPSRIGQLKSEVLHDRIPINLQPKKKLFDDEESAYPVKAVVQADSRT